MNLADIHGVCAGQTIGVIGNGPSLRDWRPARVHAICDVVIGVNRAPLWGLVDWWLTLDAEFLPLRPSLGRSAVLRKLGPSDLPFDVGPIDDRGTIVPGMESRRYAETGTFHGQRLKKKPGPNRLFDGCSSVQTALHLALLMGARKLLLFGCDGAGPRFDGTSGDQAQLRKVTAWLGDFALEWGLIVDLYSATPIPNWNPI